MLALTVVAVDSVDDGVTANARVVIVTDNDDDAAIDRWVDDDNADVDVNANVDVDDDDDDADDDADEVEVLDNPVVDRTVVDTGEPVQQYAPPLPVPPRCRPRPSPQPAKASPM